MSTRVRSANKILPENPEIFGAALAQVIKTNEEKESVLGQAWICGPDQLITCGHVVEQFVDLPNQLLVKFPASGNKYTIQTIKLHPGWLRQKDQLVKFDVALLGVLLKLPESAQKPLPICFEKKLEANQPLWTIRYPAHLGLITAAPNPLVQSGNLLGPLRKHDNFHLLHDLALAQGDSGSPLFDGDSLVAIHCGDTASLPGLDLPTTSIRLALWIDALRELNVKAQDAPSKGAHRQGFTNAIAFALAFLLAFMATTLSFLLLPVRFNRPKTKLAPISAQFRSSENKNAFLDLIVTPTNDCQIYLLYALKTGTTLIFPSHLPISFCRAGQVVNISLSKSLSAELEKHEGTFLLVALRKECQLLKDEDLVRVSASNPPELADRKKVAQSIIKFSQGGDGFCQTLTPPDNLLPTRKGQAPS